MRLLVLHQNFPGQFGALVREWSKRPGLEVRAIGSDKAPGLPGFDGMARYSLARQVGKAQHPYLRQMESAVLHGQATTRVCLAMQRQGFTPDVVLAHPGWGDSLYVKDVFPNARLVHLCEWFYGKAGGDSFFDPEFPGIFDDQTRLTTWNALHTLNLSQCDAAIAPTFWQRSQHPECLQPKIEVCHEGIDLSKLRPDPTMQLQLPNGLVLRAGDPVITYVARNLEPYRGFHIFMRALQIAQRAHPRCQALIVGGDEVGYGRTPVGATNWREAMLKEVQIDPRRTHFLGRLPYAHYLRVLQVSAAHVYLTYPFVLSWSLLEAMASGVPLIASNTAPVQEVVRDGVNGRLVDFFDPAAIADQILHTINSPAGVIGMRQQAVRDAGYYSLEHGLAGYERILGVLTV